MMTYTKERIVWKIEEKRGDFGQKKETDTKNEIENLQRDKQKKFE